MIKMIRAFYRIDQTMMALYLGANRSSISMAESNRRNLNPQQNERLYRLFHSIPRQDTSRATIEPPLPDEVLQEAITKQITANERRLAQLNIQLNQLCARQQKAINMLAGAHALAANKEEHDKDLIDIIRINANRLYRKNCDARRLQLDLDIVALEARLSVLRQKAAELAAQQNLP